MSSAQDLAATGIEYRLFAAHKTKKWLAEQLGVSISWLNRRLSGETSIDVDDLDRIATVFNLDVVDLFYLPKEVAA